MGGVRDPGGVLCVGFGFGLAALSYLGGMGQRISRLPFPVSDAIGWGAVLWRGRDRFLIP